MFSSSYRTVRVASPAETDKNRDYWVDPHYKEPERVYGKKGEKSAHFFKNETNCVVFIGSSHFVLQHDVSLT